MPQPWMIFQMANLKNHSSLLDVFYLWNGNWAVLIRDGEGLSTEEVGWTGKTAEDLSNEEIQLLNTIAADKRKKTFTIKRTGRYYRVLTRGTFPEQ